MTTIRHGGPCGLQIEMRSAEREGKSVVFSCHNARSRMPHAQRGGCGMIRTRNAAKPLSFIFLIPLWLSLFESARSRRAGEKGCVESDPPPNRGVMWPFVAVRCGIPLPGPMGVALDLIYPCGKAQKNPPFPSRFIVSDRSSPSRVRFAASRPGRLRADPKDALLTRGKGGVGPWGARAS